MTTAIFRSCILTGLLVLGPSTVQAQTEPNPLYRVEELTPG